MGINAALGLALEATACRRTNTEWLKRCAVSLDAKGFVQTGEPTAATRATTDVSMERRPQPLETSLHGVFAVGDVRAGSVKRVSGAVGEGAAVVAQLHSYLEATRPLQA